MAAKGGRARRAVFATGIVMVLAGLGMLGYVGWQFWGTNWTSSRAQSQVTKDLQVQWDKPADERRQLQPRFVPKGKASALVRIPKFGKKYVVPVLEGTSDKVLAKGFGHFEDTADPGGVGNYALAGHRVTHGEPLKRIFELDPGDRVIVETSSHTYTYRLDTDPDDLTVSFRGTWVLDPLPKNPRRGGVQPEQTAGQRLITLTTCSELFHTDNRTIVFGHLVKAVAKTTTG